MQLHQAEHQQRGQGCTPKILHTNSKLLGGKDSQKKIPLCGPGIAIECHPAANATTRGPKSRAGLKPAWVMGANTQIRTATVNPMKNGVSAWMAEEQ